MNQGAGGLSGFAKSLNSIRRFMQPATFPNIPGKFNNLAGTDYEDALKSIYRVVEKELNNLPDGVLLERAKKWRASQEDLEGFIQDFDWLKSYLEVAYTGKDHSDLHILLLVDLINRSHDIRYPIHERFILNEMFFHLV